MKTLNTEPVLRCALPWLPNKSACSTDSSHHSLDHNSQDQSLLNAFNDAISPYELHDVRRKGHSLWRCFDTPDNRLMSAGYVLLQAPEGRFFLMNPASQKIVMDFETSLKADLESFFWWDIVSKKAQHVMQPLSDVRVLRLKESVFFKRYAGYLAKPFSKKPNKTWPVRLLLPMVLPHAGKTQPQGMEICVQAAVRRKWLNTDARLLKKSELKIKKCLVRQLNQHLLKKSNQKSQALRDTVERTSDSTQNLAVEKPMQVIPMRWIDYVANTFVQIQAAHAEQIALTTSQPVYSLQALAAKQDQCQAMIQTMQGQLLQQARSYEQGVIEDIDTEFLHQYRVNLRKMRSLTSCFRDVLEVSVFRELQTGLSLAFKSTNALRDLDVLLLKQYGKPGAKPQTKKNNRFYRRLSRLRALECQSVSRWLSSPKYHRLMQSLEQCLELNVDNSSVNEHHASPEFDLNHYLRHRILKRYKKIQRQSQNLSQMKNDEAIHELRKEVKKFRYTLECFFEIYPNEQREHLLKPLRKLQNKLGLFNDVCVQKTLLEGYKHSLKQDKAFKSVSQEFIDSLSRQHQALRKTLTKTFSRFSNMKIKPYLVSH